MVLREVMDGRVVQKVTYTKQILCPECSGPDTFQIHDISGVYIS
jgi:hypothetical protein